MIDCGLLTSPDVVIRNITMSCTVQCHVDTCTCLHTSGSRMILQCESMQNTHTAVYAHVHVHYSCIIVAECSGLCN